MFKKCNVISKEDSTKVSKTWPEAIKYFQKLVTSNQSFLF